MFGTWDWLAVSGKATWITNETVLRVTAAAEEGEVDLDIRVGAC